jgi:uncharacterized protein (TIGR00369 family)
MTDIPDGFGRHTRKSPATAGWEPIHARHTPDALILAVRIAEAHCNARGLVHGGVIATLADNAMGLSTAARYDPPSGLVTVNLAVDYLGMARLGQWLDFTTVFIKTGATLAFAACLVNADGTPVARANATFRTSPR